jgi:hypothetical protein
MGCVCIRDRFGDIHATKRDTATPQDIWDAAGYLAHGVVGCDADEMVAVGLCATDDPGLARLRGGVPFAEGGIEWLRTLPAGDLPNPSKGAF